MEFREALDRLGERVTHEEVAAALGVSVASVRQYRLSADARAHRTPPAGWPEVLSKLARARGEELIELAEALNRRGHRAL
jgi:DNA-binding GntR family transcriptional regulator